MFVETLNNFDDKQCSYSQFQPSKIRLNYIEFDLIEFDLLNCRGSTETDSVMQNINWVF